MLKKIYRVLKIRKHPHDVSCKICSLFHAQGQTLNTTTKLLACITVLAALSACDGQDARPNAAAMAAASGAYKTCAACHGATGLGNEVLQAPALVNLDQDYLERQIRHYREGVRGRHPDDRWGQQMSDQAALLADDNAISAVVAQIGEFPDAAPAVTIKADLDRGRDLDGSTCGACHGPNAEGIPVLGAPALRGIDDWYLVRQYRNFRDGIRGTHEDDTLGQQMQRMGQVLKTDQDIQAVSAWIASLDIDE